MLDRALVSPEGFGRQLQLMKAIEQRTYRNGIGSPWNEMISSEGALAKLAERQFVTIKPMKLPYLQKGVDYEWFAQYSPRIDHFRRTARNDKKFHKWIVREFQPQKLDELKIRRTLKYAGFHTYERPPGLPKDFVVEFSKKNGGMSYRVPGTTTDENLVVRVCPGFAKESIVSSVIKGKHRNGEMPGTLRQQYPYVVQRRGKEYLTRYGTWIKNDDPAITHIPLEIYKFRGWE